LQHDLQHEKGCLSRSKKRAGLVVWVERVGLELGEIRRPARENIIMRLKRSLINKIPLYFQSIKAIELAILLTSLERFQGHKSCKRILLAVVFFLPVG